MASITLKGIPDPLKKRLEELADRGRRSLNQQAILLLERALAEEPTGFEQAYRQFRDRHGPSPLGENDLSGLRSDEEGRAADL
jgi:predicted transcriptional regulator